MAVLTVGNLCFQSSGMDLRKYVHGKILKVHVLIQKDLFLQSKWLDWKETQFVADEEAAHLLMLWGQTVMVYVPTKLFLVHR